MKERGILMNAAMVNAVLSGQKTQTRRIFNIKGLNISDGAMSSLKNHEPTLNSCPFGVVGDRLYVRETCHYSGFGMVQYRADMTEAEAKSFSWTPSIHMHKWASRIQLEITGVRVERLNDIPKDDVYHEGLIPQDGCDYDDDGKRRRCYQNPISGLEHESLFDVDAFQLLWESINGKDSWADNPWVWVVEFKRCE